MVHQFATWQVEQRAALQHVLLIQPDSPGSACNQAMALRLLTEILFDRFKDLALTSVGCDRLDSSVSARWSAAHSTL